jgi:hypothetical protein
MFPSINPRWAFSGSAATAAMVASILCAAVDAPAEARFGDSTWVAPTLSEPITADPSGEGPRVAPPEREPGWERTLRAPFRVAFYPLRLFGRGLEYAGGVVGDRLFTPKPKKPPQQIRVSFRVDAGGAADGDINDIGIGPSITWLDFPVPGAIVDTHASWTLNGRRRGRLVGLVADRPLGFFLRAEYDYKPNRRFFGIGNDAPESNKSYYLLENSSIETGILLGKSPLKQLRLVTGLSSISPRRGSDRSPLLAEVFDEADVPYAHAETQVFVTGFTGDYAWVDYYRDPTLGLHGRMELKHAHGRGQGDPNYNQWMFEGRGYVPVFHKRRVLALRGVYTGVEPIEKVPHAMPFYRLAISDGPYRFVGFASQRFRDRQLMLGRIEYRWAIWKRLNAVALYEVGEVAPNWHRFTADALHTSYGGGLRLGISAISVLRLDVAKSDEGVNAVLRLGSGF